MWGNIAIAFLLAFIVSFVATPYTIKIANKIGAVDVPKDKRRMHTKAMPKFGGPAVILGVLVSMIYLIAVMSIEGSLDLFSTQQYGKKLLGVLLGVIVIAITGTLDDIKTLKPWQELLGQTIAAIIVAIIGESFNTNIINNDIHDINDIPDDNPSNPSIKLIAVMSIEGSLDLFSTQQYGKKLLGVLLGVIVIAITGTLDDIKTLKPWQELLGQTIAAIIVAIIGESFNTNIINNDIHDINDIPDDSNCNSNSNVRSISRIFTI